MRAQLDIPDNLGASALNDALEGLVRIGVDELSQAMVSGHEVPSIYDSGVRYQRERDTENWLPPSAVMAAGWGDCEDLASWRAAELRVTGEDPTAAAVVTRSGPRTWHAQVSRENGSWIEDPSAALGMGSAEDLAQQNGLAGYDLQCSRIPGGWQCTLTHDGQGVMGRGPSATAAIRSCTDMGMGLAGAGVGQIPGLDLLARLARGALDAAAPPTGSPTITTPATATAPATFALPAGVPGTMAADVQRIAQQIAQLTARETRRKLSAAQRVAVTAGRARGAR